jgi:uncharacterized protein Yka (UPF0111/DUF47 family)
MAAMVPEVYEAFLDAGASPEKAKKAAEAIASYETRFDKIEQDLAVLKWIGGTNVALSIAIAVRTFFV